MTPPGGRRPSRARAAPTPDGGTAIVEFVGLAVLLLVPLVYLVVALGRVQAGALAAEGAAAEAGRAFVSADEDASAPGRARAAALVAVRDQGFGADDLALRWDCAATPCLRPDARVEVDATVRVRLPGMPRLLDHAMPRQVVLGATRVVAVDRFRATPAVVAAGPR